MADIPSSIYDELEKIYAEDLNLRDSWKHEQKVIHELLPKIAEEISYNYALVKAKAVGGGGIILVVGDKNLKVQRALKIARPSLGKEALLARVLLAETENLIRLSHQNLIHIYGQGVPSYEGTDFPYYIMEYVEGVKDSDKFLSQDNVTERDVLQVFAGSVAAVEYLHRQDTVHMDIKPANILITPEGIPLLSDLGFAKRLRAISGYTIIGGTEGYIHPEARELVQQIASDPNRLTCLLYTSPSPRDRS